MGFFTARLTGLLATRRWWRLAHRCGWCMRGSRLAPGEGVLAWVWHRLLQPPRDAPLRTRRWKCWALGENYANYLPGSCVRKYPDVGLQIRKLSWGNLCFLSGSDGPFSKHWRPGFRCQPLVWPCLTVPSNVTEPKGWSSPSHLLQEGFWPSADHN